MQYLVGGHKKAVSRLSALSFGQREYESMHKKNTKGTYDKSSMCKGASALFVAAKETSICDAQTVRWGSS